MKLTSRPEPAVTGPLRLTLADVYTMVVEIVSDNPHLGAKSLATGMLAGLVNMEHIDDFVVSEVNYGLTTSMIEVAVKFDTKLTAPFHTFLVHY